MIANILFCLTSVAATLPVSVTKMHNDMQTMVCICAVALFSTIFHFLETRNPEMPETNITLFFMYANYMAIAVLVGRLCNLYVQRNGFNTTPLLKTDPMSTFLRKLVAASILFLICSYFDCYFPSMAWLYYPMHMAWHVLAYYTLAIMLNLLYRK